MPHNISRVLRCEGRSPHPSCTVVTKTRLEPASLHQYSTKTRGSKPTSRYHYSLKSHSLKPTTWHHCSLKTQSLKPASSRVRNLRLARFGIDIRNARLEARVLTTEKLCITVITVLISGSITAHVMRRVNPHYGRFLGNSFTSETPINSSVCY